MRERAPMNPCGFCKTVTDCLWLQAWGYPIVLHGRSQVVAPVLFLPTNATATLHIHTPRATAVQKIWPPRVRAAPRPKKHEDKRKPPCKRCHGFGWSRHISTANKAVVERVRACTSCSDGYYFSPDDPFDGHRPNQYPTGAIFDKNDDNGDHLVEYFNTWIETA